MKTNETLHTIDCSTLSTFCSSGKEVDVLNGYGEAELLREEGPGCLTHMWFGGDWPGYAQTLIRVYVDGNERPDIEMEMGLGHGCGFDSDTAPWGSEKIGRTGYPSGFYNSYKIPFGNGVRVTAQRAATSPDGAPFWWIVRGSRNLPVIYAGIRLPEQARLMLHKREGLVVEPLQEFDLCHVGDAGALYQVTMEGEALRHSDDWTDFSYLEAIMRAYIDGNAVPMLLSSGLEDYFLGTYYFNRGTYANALAGLTHLDTHQCQFAGYRFHDEDPVFFQQGLRLTCRCGEELNGAQLHDPPQTRFTTYTWLYQW
jgi:hypothetical protein